MTALTQQQQPPPGAARPVGGGGGFQGDGGFQGGGGGAFQGGGGPFQDDPVALSLLEQQNLAKKLFESGNLNNKVRGRVEVGGRGKAG